MVLLIKNFRKVPIINLFTEKGIYLIYLPEPKTQLTYLLSSYKTLAYVHITKHTFLISILFFPQATTLTSIIAVAQQTVWFKPLNIRHKCIYPEGSFAIFNATKEPLSNLPVYIYRQLRSSLCVALSLSRVFLSR